MLCSVYSLPTGILRLPWKRVYRAFSSVVRQIPGYTSERRGTVRTLPNYWIVLFYVLFVLFVSIMFYVLFVCKCVLYYCHRVSTQLQLNMSYHINPLSPELNHIWYLLPLLAHHFIHVSRIRVKSLTLWLLMSHIYGAPILDLPRSHTKTQHSR
jgi:hypothetical protein